MTEISRRKALFIGAAAAGMWMGPQTTLAEARWRGQALGAHAEMRLCRLSDAEAAPIFAAVEAEVTRLEGIFSLYRPDSAVARLNRDGLLDLPPPELLELLSLCRSIHAETWGLFDPTVQPVFALYAEAAEAGRPPTADELDQALGAVGLDGVVVTPDEVRFKREGMGMTLNGIAQGYITDQITGLLRAQGLRDVLVDMGEVAAVGATPGRAGWRVRIDGGPVLTLSDRAVATSAPLGTVIDRRQGIGHILHPQFGWTLPRQKQVSVIGESAGMADAISTAAALMDGSAIETLRSRGRTIIALPV